MVSYYLRDVEDVLLVSFPQMSQIYAEKFSGYLRNPREINGIITISKSEINFYFILVLVYFEVRHLKIVRKLAVTEYNL